MLAIADGGSLPVTLKVLVQNGIYLDAAKLKIYRSVVFCFCAAEQSNYCDSSNIINNKNFKKWKTKI